MQKLSLVLLLLLALTSCEKDLIPPPNTCFEVEDYNPPLGVYEFKNCSQFANMFTWNFGDGTSSNAANGRHAYNAPGTYTVSLTAKSTTKGETVVFTKQIDVSKAGIDVNIADFVGQWAGYDTCNTGTYGPYSTTIYQNSSTNLIIYINSIATVNADVLDNVATIYRQYFVGNREISGTVTLLSKTTFRFEFKWYENNSVVDECSGIYTKQ